MSRSIKYNLRGFFKTWYFSSELTPNSHIATSQIQVTRVFSSYTDVNTDTNKATGPIEEVKNWIENLVLKLKIESGPTRLHLLRFFSLLPHRCCYMDSSICQTICPICSLEQLHCLMWPICKICKIICQCTICTICNHDFNMSNMHSPLCWCVCFPIQCKDTCLSRLYCSCHLGAQEMQVLQRYCWPETYTHHGGAAVWSEENRFQGRVTVFGRDHAVLGYISEPGCSKFRRI